MAKIAWMFLTIGFCTALTGCGDGKVEIKTKSEPPTVIETKEAPSKETIKTETKNPDGSTTTTKETKTTQ